jgi:antitoxin (DNA-binding transcriptional repressor) of toxin-antitoxin stability system
MITITIDEIHRDISGFLDLVQAGNTLLIVQADEPIAEIKPVKSSNKVKQLRPFALCAGEFVVPDDFNEPLPEDILNQFEGE